MDTTENTITDESTPQPKPCWYKACCLEGDEYDTHIAPYLRDEDYDEYLSPTCEKLSNIIDKLVEMYVNEKTYKGKPITKQPNLLKESYCRAFEGPMISFDEDERKLIMWVKGTYLCE